MERNSVGSFRGGRNGPADSLRGLVKVRGTCGDVEEGEGQLWVCGGLLWEYGGLLWVCGGLLWECGGTAWGFADSF
jgi:hypothetical protein